MKKPTSKAGKTSIETQRMLDEYAKNKGWQDKHEQELESLKKLYIKKLKASYPNQKEALENIKKTWVYFDWKLNAIRDTFLSVGTDNRAIFGRAEIRIIGNKKDPSQIVVENNHIRINPVLIYDNNETYNLAHVVGHEIAHAFALFAFNAEGHGKIWLGIMKKLKLSPLGYID